MNLPNIDKAIISKDKVENYLLNESHPDGRGKAKFFKKIGFSNVEKLRNGLHKHIREGKVVSVFETEFGTKYIIEGPIESPAGTKADIRSVWFIDLNKEIPKLVTAYPL